MKKFWEMAENLSERGFIGEVVKAEILHFVQDDAPGRERLLRQRFFATLRVTKQKSLLLRQRFFTCKFLQSDATKKFCR